MKVLFMGRKQASADALEWMVTQGFDIAGVMTDNHLRVSPTTSIARKYDLPLFSHDEAESAVLKGSLDFDFGISLVYWRILKEPFIAHPKFGIINLHPAPLPEYKGTAGYNMAIMDELDSWAVTAHYIDAGIDTGRIIEVLEFKIDHMNETALSLERKCQEYLLSLFKKTVNRVRGDGLLPSVENEGGRYISRDEMESMKLVQSSDDIDKKIRAFWFPPYTGAYVEISGARYTLVNSRILEELADSAASNLFVKSDQE